jgi:DNA invertase Pin-like site-specific DNA recombinase
MSQVAIYARSAVANSNNINSQIKSSKELARNLGLEVTKIYIDDGKSGTTINRPSLANLLADAKSKKFDAVISTDSNRLARNANVYKSIKEQLKSAGVKNIYADSAKDFVEIILEALAKCEMQIRSEMVKRGICAAKERKARKL